MYVCMCIHEYIFFFADAQRAINTHSPVGADNLAVTDLALDLSPNLNLSWKMWKNG